MSKLVSPSASDSFNSPGSGPGNPSNINWKMLVIYSGITISAVCVFGYMINKNQKQTFQFCHSQIKSMNETHATELEKRDKMMTELIKSIQKTDSNTLTNS